jgi:cephalosporin hydroxylase
LLPLDELERRHLDHHSLPLGTEPEIVEAFHRLSYDAARRGDTWHAARFRGYPVYKWVGDLWIYMEIIMELRPKTIIETGTAEGGSAYYFASLLDWLGKDGTVISVDIAPLNPQWPAHDRIFYVPSFSSADWPPKRGTTAGGMQVTVPPSLRPPVMVVLDSDHARDHVLKELDVYAPLVSEGSYLVVEDSNVNGHPVLHEHGPGPFEAVQDWLPQHPEYREDRSRPARQLFSYHTWLRKVPVQSA